MPGSIFISYRRSSGSWSARTLHDGLKRDFDESQLFIDVADIEHGTDFVHRLEREIGRCDAMIAVIDPQWLDAADEAGNRRLDDPADYIGIEIGMGLKRRIPVIPVLVDGARMPTEAELPDALKPLSQRNAIAVRHASFDADIKRLAASLHKLLGDEDRGVPGQADPPGMDKRWYAAGAVAAAIFVAGLLLSIDFGGERGEAERHASADNGGVAPPIMPKSPLR